ncbi:hypothetical protein [Spiroplasma endosymbiont of Nebria brevicollis]|uniref:hypothetical protein n=1 Tax=Spiroplasma endosymbiont of Nebria brevicollis TaxID=3066284 RepID=UPI00313DCD2C
MSKINNCACEQLFHLSMYMCKLCDQVICPKKVLQNLYTKQYYCPNCILDIALNKTMRKEQLQQKEN